MSNKQLINNVSLNTNDEGATISAELVIPVLKLRDEDKKKIKGDNLDLGVISFSEKTSELIVQVGEAIRKELLSKL